MNSHDLAANTRTALSLSSPLHPLLVHRPQSKPVLSCFYLRDGCDGCPLTAGSCDRFPPFSAFSVEVRYLDKYHGNFRPPLSNIPAMDTERLLKLAQEYFEHDYAPYVGGASLLAGAAVWFYATDISRVFKVG